MSTREVTKTGIRHGKEDGEVVVIPAGKNFSEYSKDFSKDETEALRVAGSIGPQAEVDEALADENQNLALQVADLKAQLEAALAPANQHAPAGSGAEILVQQQAEQKRLADEQAKADANKK